MSDHQYAGDGYQHTDDVVGAIRLAIEGAANADVALEVIETLCGYAGPTDPDSTIPTKLFVDAIRALDGTFALNQKVTA